MSQVDSFSGQYGFRDAVTKRCIEFEKDTKGIRMLTAGHIKTAKSRIDMELPYFVFNCHARIWSAG